MFQSGLIRTDEAPPGETPSSPATAPMVGATSKERHMKRSHVAALAVAALAASALQAHACNPMLAKNFGKHVPPASLPAAMLARNNPAAGNPLSTVGLWHDVRTASDGTLFMEGYDTWNRDGTEIELANLPPATGNVCVGVWVRRGNTVALRAHVAWLYDLNNNFVGTLDITQTSKVAADGNSYTGTFDAKFFDPNGNQFQEVTGTTAAERLVQ
jgi:hypothetical protein